MREIEAWIRGAAVRLGITLEALSPENSKLVTEAIQQRYVKGSPRVWWLGFRTPYVYFDVDSVRLSQVLPRLSGNVYFIAEEDDGLPLIVYLIEAGNLESLIGDCTFFEYYVADTENEWIVAETEHDVFLVCYPSNGSLRVAPGGQIWTGAPGLDLPKPQ